MKRVQMFGGVRFAPRKTSTTGDLSEFTPVSKAQISWWTSARKKVARLFDNGRCREGRTGLQTEEARWRAVETEVRKSKEREEVAILAEATAMVAQQIEDEKQQAVIEAEEASLALHFRKKKEKIEQALMLLERQGRAKRAVSRDVGFFQA